MMKLIKWIVIVAILIVAGTAVYYSFFPDIGKLKKSNPRKTAFMESKEQEWKSKGTRVKVQKKWVRFSKISPFVVKAVLIAEDDKFWRHKGFDFDAIEKAIEKDIQAGSFKVGGSTISQQLIKNLYLSSSKNPVRKIVEAYLTFRMEHTLTKRRILELYLNVVEWGEGIYGIEAASLHYFGKPSSLVTAAEAARLAAVLPNPIRFTVNGNSRFVQRRADLIYRIMVKRGIVVEDYEEALKDPESQNASPDHDLPQNP
jgi:monofunctional glycosyltransferase